MPFSRPTLQQLDDRIQADFKNRIEDSQSFLRRSVLKVLGRVYAGAAYLMYGFINYVKDQIFASTADSENLENHGSDFGITRKAATYASGEGTAGGTVGKSIPAGTKLASNAGYVYVVDSDVTIGAGGTADVPFTAEIGGADSNDDAGISLSFITPIAGVNTTITVDSNGITGGVDEEDDDDLRDRVLTRKRQPPHGGAEFDYENWALEVSGVTRAWSFPQYQGQGTIGLAFVRDDDEDSIIPDADQRETVRDYIIEHTDPLTGVTVGIPATVEEGFYVIDVSLESLDFTISILPNTAAVQADVTSKLEDLILNKGGPGETIYLSDVSAAIASSALETAHKIDSPAVDIGIATNKIPVLGTITWDDY